ncbi:MAG: DUF2284 domain-containing protein [Candidatus Aminicenantes bacterium]|nr:DUF2284 domain-containing protein [Candidatus Aminicenantes bacterium]
MPREDLEKIFIDHGFGDFKWLNPSSVVISQWVRVKCLFGCPDYDVNATCPPNGLSLPESERFFREYENIAVFHFAEKMDQPEDRHDWTEGISRQLIEMERRIFLSGYRKVFLLPPDNCHYCKKCVDVRGDCKHPKIARPSPESLGMDVFATVRSIGYPIDVLSDYDEVMNRYAFLLIE